ncbi:LysR substrate-binding domain-containing protein [Solibacillus sp. FSL H8-0538]|uniref:LysR substrate-binding domain-containing protein n=1 Tax=Solibacillus sp. FSL H8-0538 TaxID=2921400 RepID=UPI0030F7C532
MRVEKLVEKGEVDVAFVVIPTQSKELEEQLIFEAPFVACLPKKHFLKDEHQITLAQLQHDEWILFDATFALRQIVIDSCRRENFVPNIAYSTTQWDLLMALVRDELGVAIVPRPLTEMYIQHLSVKEIGSQYIPWKIGLVVKKNSYKTNTLQAFLKIVSEVFQPNMEIKNTDRIQYFI